MSLTDDLIALIRQHAPQIEAHACGEIELHYSPAEVELYVRAKVGKRKRLERRACAE